MEINLTQKIWPAWMASVYSRLITSKATSMLAGENRQSWRERGRVMNATGVYSLRARGKSLGVDNQDLQVCGS